MYRVAREWKVCWEVGTFFSRADLSGCFLLPPSFKLSFDGSLAEPDSCSQIRDQETTRQDTGMLEMFCPFKVHTEKVFTVEVRDSLQWVNLFPRYLDASSHLSRSPKYYKNLIIDIPSCHSRCVLLSLKYMTLMSKLQIHTYIHKVIQTI